MDRLLPKNPQLADWLISHALERKYGKKVELTPLDDSQEKEANDVCIPQICKGIIMAKSCNQKEKDIISGKNAE